MMRFTLKWLNKLLDKKIDIQELEEILSKSILEIEKIENQKDIFQNYKCVQVEKIDGNLVYLKQQKEPIESEKILCPEDAILWNGKEIATWDMIMHNNDTTYIQHRLQIGKKATDFLNDIVVTVEITPNRKDLLSVLGIAREVAIRSNRNVIESNILPTNNKKNEISFHIDKIQTDCFIEIDLISVGIKPSNTEQNLINYIKHETGNSVELKEKTIILKDEKNVTNLMQSFACTKNLIEKNNIQIQEYEFSSNIKQQKYTFEIKEILEVLNGITEEEILQSLQKKMQIEKNENQITVFVPEHRINEIKTCQDINEEIIDTLGIDKINEISLPLQNIKTEMEVQEEIRRALVSRELDEVVTWSFVNKEEILDFTQEITNPMSSKKSVMRPSLIPSLVQQYIKTTNRNYDIKGIFEIANIYHKEEELIATCLYEQDSNNIFQVKKDLMYALETILETQKIDFASLKSEYHEKGSIKLLYCNEEIATLGKVNKLYLSNRLKTEKGFFVSEIYIDKLKREKKFFKEKSIYPRVKRDINFILPKEMYVSEIVRKIMEISSEIEKVKVIDIWPNENSKAVNFRVFFNSTKQTLTDNEINILTKKVVSKVLENSEVQVKK